MFKKFFLIIIFFSLTINFLKADEKVFYIDIDYLMTNTVAGKELLNKLKKEDAHRRELTENRHNLSEILTNKKLTFSLKS